MKNIFVEEMNQDEILLEEILRDQLSLKIAAQQDEKEYYSKALECDLKLMEEESYDNSEFKQR